MIDYVEGPWQQVLVASVQLYGPDAASHGEEIVLEDNWSNEGSIEVVRTPGSEGHSSSDGALTFVDYELDSDGNKIGYRMHMDTNGAGGYEVRLSYPASDDYSDVPGYKRDTHLIRCPSAGQWEEMFHGKVDYDSDTSCPSFHVFTNKTDEEYSDTYEPSKFSDVLPFSFGGEMVDNPCVNNWCDKIYRPEVRRHEIHTVYKGLAEMRFDYEDLCGGGEHWSSQAIDIANMNIDDGCSEDCEAFIDKVESGYKLMDMSLIWSEWVP